MSHDLNHRLAFRLLTTIIEAGEKPPTLGEIGGLAPRAFSELRRRFCDNPSRMFTLGDELKTPEQAEKFFEDLRTNVLVKESSALQRSIELSARQAESLREDLEDTQDENARLQERIAELEHFIVKTSGTLSPCAEGEAPSPS